MGKNRIGKVVKTWITGKRNGQRSFVVLKIAFIISVNTAARRVRSLSDPPLPPPEPIPFVRHLNQRVSKSKNSIGHPARFNRCIEAGFFFQDISKRFWNLCMSKFGKSIEKL